MINLFREVLRRTARPILLTVAVLYFLIDLIFLSVVRPLRRRIMALSWMRKSREWVGNLNRYAALLLLLVPWLVLEPIKPLGSSCSPTGITWLRPCSSWVARS
jgi:hypothetical protein